MNTIVYIALLKNQHRIKHNRADGAVTSDQSTDPVITRDPNNYLAPVSHGGLLHVLMIIMAVVIIVYTCVLISKQLKSAS